MFAQGILCLFIIGLGLMVAGLFIRIYDVEGASSYIRIGKIFCCASILASGFLL